MTIGDVNVDFSFGGLNNQTVTPSIIKVHEHLLGIFGPLADARIIDSGDALGAFNINGSEQASISITDPDIGQTATFDLTGHKNNNLNDNSKYADQQKDGGGAMHYKQYDLKFCSPEYVHAQGNFVSKSYNTQCDQIIKDVVQNYFKSNKSIETPDTCEAQKRMLAHNEHSLSFMKKVMDESVSSQNQSSCYFLYATRDGGSQKYVYETIENMFKNDSGITLNQNTTLSAGASEQEKRNAIIQYNPPSVFNREPRALQGSVQKTYNCATGNCHTPETQEFKPQLGGQLIYSQKPDQTKEVAHRKIHDPSNNKQKQRASTAKVNRAITIGHIMQNAAKIRIVGNPGITIGKTISLDLLNKNAAEQQSEKQINGKVLVVGIKHIILPMGARPRYLMDLTVIKGGFEEGGGSNG